MSILTKTSLPVIDFTPFTQDVGVAIGEEPTQAQLEVAALIDKANSEFGFLCLKNCGIDRKQAEECFKGAKDLFALPQDVKETKLYPVDLTDQGYVSPSRLEIVPEFPRASMEAFKIGEGNHYEHCPDSFTKTGKKLLEDMNELKRRYTMATALALGVDPNELLAFLTNRDLCVIRYNHYPPEYDFDAASPVSRMGPHTDLGFHTFLLLNPNADTACGLQIQPRSRNHNQGWTPVEIPDGEYCVVNIGDMMGAISGQKWKATRHRVLLSNVDQAKTDRYSIACFMNPGSDAEIKTLPSLAKNNKAAVLKATNAGNYYTEIVDKALKDSYKMEYKDVD